MWIDRAIRWLLPRDDRFFSMLLHGADCALRSSKLLCECCRAPDTAAREEIVAQLKAVEDEADRVIVEVYKELNRTFVTPIDRSDIYALGTALERITDDIFGTALQIIVHAMDDLPTGSQEMALLVEKATVELQAAVAALQPSKNNHLAIRRHCKMVNTIENEGDEIFRSQLALMFKNETNAIRLLKHKEFLEGLERTLDTCDDVSNVLATIVIKNS